MLDSLRQYLQTSVPPDFRAAIEEAFEIFDDYGLPDVDVGFEDILLTANNEGESETPIRINALVEDLQDHIFSQMQIKVVEECRVSEANMLLRALKLIETTEFNTEIVEVCSHNSDPIETLSEVIHLVTGVDVERIMPLFEEVSQDLINTTRAVASMHAGEVREILNVDLNRVLMQRFLAYRTAMDNQPLFIYDMLIAGVPLNQPYASYHEKIMSSIETQEIQTPLDPRLRPIKTAVQLCGAIVIASDTQDANMRNIVMSELEKTYSDIDTITPIYREIDSIMIKFHDLTTSGTQKVT